MSYQLNAESFGSEITLFSFKQRSLRRVLMRALTIVVVFMLVVGSAGTRLRVHVSFISRMSGDNFRNRCLDLHACQTQPVQDHHK